MTLSLTLCSNITKHQIKLLEQSIQEQLKPLDDGSKERLYETSASFQKSLSRLALIYLLMGDIEMYCNTLTHPALGQWDLALGMRH
jgi:hypothetical protein